MAGTTDDVQEPFTAAATAEATLLAQMAKLDVAEVQRRLQAGHRPYLAWLGDSAVAYGWVATRSAHIGELDLTIALPAEDRYLWDFATLPEWRGRGIYPRLLQAIVRQEAAQASRLWIIAAPENRASSAGIAKAGFTSVAQLSFQRSGQPGLLAMAGRLANERIAAAASLLQLPVVGMEAQQTLAPCWHCAIDARAEGQALDTVACWPAVPAGEVPLTSCRC
jgi:GNAT superfamily N-acetyltransferase